MKRQAKANSLEAVKVRSRKSTVAHVPPGAAVKVRGGDPPVP